MRLLALLLLLLTAAAPPDRLLRSEVLTGRLVGWEMGDYLWATIATEGGQRSAQPGQDPIGPFLEARRGLPLTIRIDTVSTYVPEAGGMTEIDRIGFARDRRENAASWWQRLSPAERRAARRRFEAAIR